MNRVYKSHEPNDKVKSPFGSQNRNLMSTPLVSIIIPVFNRENVIGRAVDSALAQAYSNCEIIVVDDGSTDRTAELLKDYGSKITIVRQENSGPSAARNRGVGVSRGEMLAFLDSDDSWSEGKISKQVELLVKGGDQVPCCICSASIHSNDDDEVNSFDSAGVRSKMESGYWLNADEIISSRFVLLNQVVVVRRWAFDRIGGFSENLKLLEDYDFALRLSLLGPWAFINQPLVRKFNDVSGIGVYAMSEEKVHSRAWRKVLEEFLLENPHAKKEFRKRLETTLLAVRMWIIALNLLEGGGLGACVGRAILIYSRCKKALARRLPSWPRPRVVSDLG